MGYTFPMSIDRTYVNGTLVYDKGIVDVNYRGRELVFDNYLCKYEIGTLGRDRWFYG